MTIPNCSGETSYFSSSDFMALAFHVMTAIEIPVHAFVFYVIVYKTPARMVNVKWYMFNVHFWSAMLDVSFTFLVTPYFIFPATAGYSLGVFIWIGFDPVYQVTVLVIEIGSELTKLFFEKNYSVPFSVTIISILVLFENRYTALASSREVFWKRFRKGSFVILYIVAWTYFIPFIFQVPDPNLAVPIVLNELPTIRCFYTGPIFVFTLDSTVVARVTMLKLIVEFSYLGILVYMTFQSLIKEAKNAALSKNTLALQRKFFISIVIQTVIPFAILILPISYCGYSMSTAYYNQTFNNLAFIVISSHGLISTVAILLIHEPYRTSLFGKCLRNRENRVSAPNSNTTQQSARRSARRS
ncbi:CRE-SRI-24 protein [Caenorhabditis remanei]|uniref:CRE-SRI-24 protein n=1 Tax=Caenorhabditis remanei TaxID=31234 RepID=E3LHZ2_CAERE|nr:CRE-SRI-24 protein [Caenorhabditis remanei]